MSINVVTDLRSVFGPVRDQGYRKTCLSFAGSDAHQFAANLDDLLCVEWLYFHSLQEEGGKATEGTTVRATRTVLQDIGQPYESVWPYSIRTPELSSWTPPEVTGNLFKAKTRQCNNDFNLIWRYIEFKTPVIIVFKISSEFVAAASNGSNSEIPMNLDPLEKEISNHGVIVLGCGLYDGKRVYLIRNSWGKGWGSNGNAWVFEDYLTPRFIDGFVFAGGGKNVI